MPTEQQLVKLFPVLRQGWLYILGIVALNAIRRWLLNKAEERLPFAPRHRRAPSKTERRGPPPQSQAARRSSSKSSSSETTRPPQQSGHQHSHAEALSEPIPTASITEIGPDWHFEGRRKWQWLHDGCKPNGWIEFGAKHVLRTSLCDSGRGYWDRQDNGDMTVTFGKCHHIVFLLDSPEGEPPMFELRKRVMKDGSPLRKIRVGTPTRGRLDIDT